MPFPPSASTRRGGGREKVIKAQHASEKLIPGGERERGKLVFRGGFFFRRRRHACNVSARLPLFSRAPRGEKGLVGERQGVRVRSST